MWQTVIIDTRKNKPVQYRDRFAIRRDIDNMRKNSAEMGINMEKRIKNYRKYMDSLIEGLQKDGKQDVDVEALKKEHLTQIAFFCHERLVHLIVTVVFALLEMLSLMLVVLSAEIYTMLLTVVILVLLVPYIRHYYILENEVQKMYGQYDKLNELQKGALCFSGEAG